MKNALCSILLVLFLTGCKTTLVSTHSIPSDETTYQEAIVNSMSPAPNKVYRDLVMINKRNKELIRKEFNGEEYVLVVTWKKDTTYYVSGEDGFYDTGKYPIWVTTAPELYDRMKGEGGDINVRLKQLLGLPPNSVYNYFIEFWVRPQDLFRPCPDSEVTDSECSLCFPDNTPQSYIQWINDNRISRYYQCDLYDKYPWTQLGYTYDWNPSNTTHIGLSEFVIGENKKLIVNRIYSTQDYLSK